MEFTEAQKRCFVWGRPDGTPAYADPLLTHRHLQALFEGDIGRVAAELESDQPQIKHQATALCRWAVCEAFGLTPFDETTGEGTTAAGALQLLADFLNWIDVQKKSGGTPPVSSSAG